MNGSKKSKRQKIKIFYSLFLSETRSRIGTKNKYRVTDAKIKMNLGELHLISILF